MLTWNSIPVQCSEMTDMARNQTPDRLRHHPNVWSVVRNARHGQKPDPPKGLVSAVRCQSWPRPRPQPDFITTQWSGQCCEMQDMAKNQTPAGLHRHPMVRSVPRDARHGREPDPSLATPPPNRLVSAVKCQTRPKTRPQPDYITTHLPGQCCEMPMPKWPKTRHQRDYNTTKPSGQCCEMPHMAKSQTPDARLGWEPDPRLHHHPMVWSGLWDARLGWELDQRQQHHSTVWSVLWDAGGQEEWNCGRDLGEQTGPWDDRKPSGIRTPDLSITKKYQHGRRL